MSRRLADVCLVVVLLLGFHMHSHAVAATGELKSNPFVQPVPEKKVTEKTQDTVAVLELRGVMIAGSRSQANIGGVIISIGEEIDGYELVTVMQRHVVLVKNGVKKILTIDVGGRSARND